MKSLELNEKIQAQLLEFETLNTIKVSEKWDSELRIRLELQQQYPTNKNVNYTLFFISLAIINCFIVMFSLIKTNEVDTLRSSNLEMISNELLITSN